MRELAEVVGAICFGFLVFLALIVAPAFLFSIQMEKWQCEGYARDTGKATKYGNAMCFIQDGQYWYAWEEYKHRLVARGEMKK